MKTAMIRARVEPALKREAERVLLEVGLAPAEAIRLFYKQIVLRSGLPFEARLPKSKQPRRSRKGS